MPAQPRLEYRPEQPYVAIGVQVNMPELGTVLPPLTPQVLAWLGRRGVAPTGAPFWRYLVINRDGALEVEVGVPVSAPMPGDDRVSAGVLPAGRYATLLHVGHPDRLYDATRALLDWAEQSGLVWQVSPCHNGEVWRARLEWYLTDPAVEPDMNRWRTELAFLIED